VLGDAVALAVLLHEPLVDERANARAHFARWCAAEVRPRQPDRAGKLVDTSVGRVAQGPEQIVVEIHS